MEQPTSAPPGETARARGARATREFLDDCLDAAIVFELCKLVLAVCVGVLATLWLTGTLAPAARTGMPAADAHCTRADTGTGR